MKNENQLDKMVDILDALHEYVPTNTCHTTISCPVEASKVPIRVDYMHKLLFGGTVARVRGAKRMRAGSMHGTGQLEGFIPVVEDWHAKVCLLEVCILHIIMHNHTLLYHMFINMNNTSCKGDLDSTIQRDKYMSWNPQTIAERDQQI